ncbi:MAG: MarR family transcriptional regulator [bacterium]|nr:MarR family transcriptional regulator [bacterium]
MELEKEIMVINFRNEYHKAVVNLKYTGNWISMKTSSILKPYGISNQQYNVLRILRGMHPEPATVNLLIERMLDKSSNASRIVDKLVSKGLADRVTSANDRRAVDVFITKKGLGILKSLDSDIINVEEGVSKNLNTKETNELNRLLDKLRS